MGQIFPDANLSKEFFKCKTRREKNSSHVLLTKNYFLNMSIRLNIYRKLLKRLHNVWEKCLCECIYSHPENVFSFQDF